LQYVQHLIYFCNIQIKHLQHTSETAKTLEAYACNMHFQHNITLLLGQIEARRFTESLMPVWRSTPARSGDGGVAGGQVQCPRRVTPHVREARARMGGCGASGAVPLRWRKAAEEGTGHRGRGAASQARTGASVVVGARDEHERATWTVKRGVRMVGRPEENIIVL
jgi:hypothetical protein